MLKGLKIDLSLHKEPSFDFYFFVLTHFKCERKSDEDSNRKEVRSIIGTLTGWCGILQEAEGPMLDFTSKKYATKSSTVCYVC